MKNAQNFSAAAATIFTASMIMTCFSSQSVKGWKIDEVKGWKGEELKHLNVIGKVMCQDCSQGWNQWKNSATPLKDSKVAVTCMDARKRVVHHVSDQTDEQGEFEILLNKEVQGRKLKPEDCSVRLVSSPDKACNVKTNFGNGKTGVKLLRPSHVYPSMVKYTVGPFYFTSPMCDVPDMSQAKEGSGY